MQGRLIRIGTNGAYKITPLDAPPEYEQLHEAVGGYIEVVPSFNVFEGEHCVAFCNEEGKLKNLPYNQKATELWYSVLGFPANDVLVGDVAVVVGDDELLSAL